MESKVEVLEGNQKKVTVTVDAKEIDARIKKQYKDFAYKYNFPGFRRGKAPRPIIDNFLGPQAAVGQVTDDVVNELFPLAMDEHDLIAMGQPEFEFEEELVQAGKPYTYTATVETRPEFELSSYDPVTVKLPPEEATEAEIDAQIDELREYYYEFKDCPEGSKVQEGSFVEMTVAATDEQGNAIDSLAADSRLYELGQGMFPAAFDEALLGMAAGESKAFEADMSKDSMLGASLEDAGMVKFDVTVNQVKEKVLPELDDEWAKEKAGFESLASMRDLIAQNLNMQKASMMGRLRETEALYELQQRLEGEAPEALCEAEEQNLLQSFFMQINESGLSFDAYLAQAGMTPDSFKEDIKKQACDVAAQDLALDAWARNAKIEITDEDISAEFEKAGVDNPKAMEKEWREKGQMAMLRAGMRRQRAIEQILDTLVVEPLEEAPAEAAAAEDAQESEE